MIEFREIIFRSADDPVLDDIVALLGSEWHGFSAAGLFRKYSANPAALPDTPHFICAYDDGKLVAANGYIPARYAMHGMTLVGVQDCDSFVARDYRKRGLFASVIERAEQLFAALGYDFIYGFPNMKSFKAYQNAGWTHVRDILYTVRPIDPSGAIDRLKTRRIEWLFAPAAAVMRGLLRHRVGVIAKRWEARGYLPSVTEGCHYEDVSPANGDAARLILDQEYVSWRFSRDRGNYSSHCVVGPDGAMGKVLLMIEEGRRTWKVLAVSGTSEEARTAALAFTCAAAASQASKVLACVPPDDAGLTEYRRCGFMSPRLVARIWDMRTPFMFRSFKPAAETASWQIQFADYDTV